MLKDGERGKFNINNETGEITTSHIFDRDEPSRNKEVYVTVQATDNGRPTLADVCTFKITITDINDNSPIFDKTVRALFVNAVECIIFRGKHYALFVISLLF